MRRLRIGGLVAALAAFAAGPAWAQRCCMNLGENPETQRLAEGIRQGTLVLLGALCLLAGAAALGYGLAWKRRSRPSEEG